MIYLNPDRNELKSVFERQSLINYARKYSHFFYIHDTCTFMECFIENISKYINSMYNEKYRSKNRPLWNTTT